MSCHFKIRMISRTDSLFAPSAPSVRLDSRLLPSAVVVQKLEKGCERPEIDEIGTTIATLANNYQSVAVKTRGWSFRLESRAGALAYPHTKRPVSNCDSTHSLRISHSTSNSTRFLCEYRPSPHLVFLGCGLHQVFEDYLQ